MDHDPLVGEAERGSGRNSGTEGCPRKPRKLCSGFPPGTPVSTDTIEVVSTVSLIFI